MSESAKIARLVDVFSMASMLAMSCGRRAADLDPAHDDLGGALEAVLDAVVVDVHHRRADARAGVRRGDPGSHQAGAEHAGRADLTRLDRRVGHARVARQPVLHEEDGDQVAQDRRADDLADGLLLGLQALVERQVATLADRLERDQGAGYCPLVFDLTKPSATAKANIISSWSRPSGWRSCLAARLPLAALLEVLDPPLALLDEPVGGDGVEDQAERRGLLRRDRLARGDHLDRRVQADQARQPLRAAPAGDQADLDLGQRDLGVRLRRRRSGRPSTGPARCRRPCSCRRSGRPSGTAAG